MPYTLRIIFDGIVVTGPPAPPQPAPGLEDSRPGPFYGVMPLLGRRLSRLAPPTSNEKWYIPSHVPVIIASDHLVNTGREPDEKSDKGFFLWYPLRERMEFAFDDIAYPGKLTYKHDDGPQQAGEYHIHSVDKVPRLEWIYPDRDRLANGTLDRRPPAHVAAQIFVPRGEVSGGADDNKRGEGVLAKFLPTRTGDENEHEIVPNAVVTIRNIDKVSIRMSSLDSGQLLDPIVFTLTRDEDIRIANGDPENIAYLLRFLSSGKDIEVTRSKPQYGDIVVDTDFEGVYDLLAGPDDGQAMPVPFYDKKFGMTNCYGGSGKPPTG